MRPVVILAQPRSRSSLVANVFVEHGLWAGRVNRLAAGYIGWENLQMKEWLRANYGPLPDVRGGHPLYPVGADIREAINAFMPAKERWMFKCFFGYWPIFQNVDCDFVLVHRDPEGIAKSHCEKASTPMEYEDVLALTRRRIDYINYMAESEGYPVVYTNDVVAGDRSSLRTALERCGIVPDECAIERAIN